ncbi:unnamed protein product [Trichobilharzia szidati]|nr:unnamed protein product [Trichobilharzia szidati]
MLAAKTAFDENLNTRRSGSIETHSVFLNRRKSLMRLALFSNILVSFLGLIVVDFYADFRVNNASWNFLTYIDQINIISCASCGCYEAGQYHLNLPV